MRAIPVLVLLHGFLVLVTAHHAAQVLNDRHHVQAPTGTDFFLRFFLGLGARATLACSISSGQFRPRL